MNVRETAYKTAYEILEKGKPSHVAIREALSGAAFCEKRDRAFFTRLVEGTCERLVTIDLVIGLVSKVPVKKLKPQMRTVLRTGIYQILYMDSVPDPAACNESVKILKSTGLSGLSGYANGVLRRIAREKDEIVKKIESDPKAYYSCPDWLFELLVSQYGNETALEILKGYFSENGVTLRVNLSKTSVSDVIRTLEASGITVKTGTHHAYALKLSDIDDVLGLPGFSDGLFSIQDESSMYVCEKAGIGKDDSVLDICAAPGGKTLHAADILKCQGGCGRVLSRDLTQKKVELIRENISKCGFDNADTECFDATVFDAGAEGSYDVVLADVPCSGLGIIGKKPDIKENMTPEKMEELIALQRTILKNAVRYLKPGGTFMFSTCTINRHENDDNVTFISDTLGLALDEKRQLLPGIDGCDGFFYARFKKLP